jgi:LacI family transcriptional regulator
MVAARRVREIGLAFPRGAHQEVFIEGVLRYASDHQCNWSYITAPESLSLSVLDLIGWPGDGILAALNTAQEAACAASLGVPVVNISSALVRSPVPRSIVDNHAIGTLAADHLIGKGFQAHAFYGLSDVQYSKDRQAGFEERLAGAGYRSVEFLSKPTFGLGSNLWLQQYRVLAEWLAGLPTPCGLFAVSDYRARQALDACRQVGLQVPEQIAVIGVDNEQVICEHAFPTLTSVARNDQLEGYRAAAMLDRLLHGKRVSLEEPPIPPLQVVERESTATFAVSDARLRDALSYLHQHIEKPITIDQITTHAGVSRRWLEYAFRDTLGETPYQYLRRQRLAMARRLLAEDRSAKVYCIAQQTGFSSAKQLAIAFQQDYGMSPREYRKSTQA